LIFVAEKRGMKIGKAKMRDSYDNKVENPEIERLSLTYNSYSLEIFFFLKLFPGGLGQNFYSLFLRPPEIL